MMRDKGRVLKRGAAIFFMAGVFLLGGGALLPAAQPALVSAQIVHPCRNRVNIPIDQLHWLYIPESADQLYSDERLYYLGGQLIQNKVVDASACPSAGLMRNGYANACGMATAMPTVIAVQNMLNEPILQAWKDVGVPPVLLKRLIRFESQFWPSMHELHTTTHFGFGSITAIGMRSALQWNPRLYDKVCLATAGDDCLGYDAASLALATLLNVCPTCPYGIDATAAYRSVDILAEVLMGYCYQTAQMVIHATGWNANQALDYATLWRLTLMNYNAGPTCVINSLVSTFEITEGPMRWGDISPNVAGDLCIRGLGYANNITARYFDFPPRQ